MYATPTEENTLDKYDEPRLHMERLMRVRLVEFDLSLRILIPLESAGIKTLGDLTSKSKSDLKRIKSLGAVAIGKLVKLLDHQGLSLKA